MIFDEMIELEKLIFLKGAGGNGKPIHEYTASGNPLSFQTNIAKPLKSLLIPWTPTQSGSGDPSPENVRPISGVSAVNVEQTGKNLACVSTYVQEQDRSSNGITYHAVNKSMVHVKGLASGDSYMVPSGQSADTKLKAGKYTISSNLPNENGSRVYITSATESISYHAVYSGHPVTKTISSDLDDVQVQINIGIGTDIDMDVWVQIELGETASSYTPYVGTTIPVTFPALGRNLINPSACTDGWIWWKGVLTAGYATNSATEKIPVKPGQTYRLARNSGSQNYISWFDSNGDYISQEAWAQSTPTKTIPDGAYFIGISLAISEKNNAMLSEGSTEYPFEPYTNTVYGGSLDLTTGVLTVEWATKELSDLEFTFYDTASGHLFRSDSINGSALSYGTTNFILPCYKTVTSSSRTNLTASCSVTYKLDIIDNDYDDAETFTASLDGIICYELATPLTYQLTPTQITALLGDNTIWSDTNGTNTAVYLKRG